MNGDNVLYDFPPSLTLIHNYISLMNQTCIRFLIPVVLWINIFVILNEGIHSPWLYRTVHLSMRIKSGIFQYYSFMVALANMLRNRELIGTLIIKSALWVRTFRPMGYMGFSYFWHRFQVYETAIIIES